MGSNFGLKTKMGLLNEEQLSVYSCCPFGNLTGSSTGLSDNATFHSAKVM